jgi:hypothetical protein
MRSNVLAPGNAPNILAKIRRWIDGQVQECLAGFAGLPYFMRTLIKIALPTFAA